MRTDVPLRLRRRNEMFKNRLFLTGIVGTISAALCCFTPLLVKGVEATLEVGISPGLNMIFGSIGDTPETLGQAVDFLLKYDDCCEIRTIRPVTPYPGSPLYYDAIEKGLLAGPEDFYENKHLNADLLAVNFTELSDDEFYACLQDANRRLLENYHRHQRQASLDQVAELYQTRDTSFRGFRPV